MKIFFKILLFIVTMFVITVGDVKSSTVATTLCEETLSSFIQKSQHSDILFKNQNKNSCLNGENVLTYSEQVRDGDENVARGGDVLIDVAKATEKQLDEIFVNLAKDPPYKYAANTIEHKAERWAQYKIEKGATAKDYETWSNLYNANMSKATKAN